MKKLFVFALFLLCFSAGESFAGPLPFSVKTVKIKKNDTYFKLFGKDWKIAANLNRIDEKNLRVGRAIIAPASPADWKAAKSWSPLAKRDETVAKFKKAVVVDLKSQYFGAYERGKLKFWGPISSGSEKCLKTVGDEEIESKCPTPSGFFRSLARHKDHISSEYQDAEGNGVKMPYAVMFTIQKDKDKNKQTAYWIHGGALPGYPASHGCVRVREEDAEKIFYFVSPAKENEESAEIEWFPPKKSIPIIVTENSSPN